MVEEYIGEIEPTKIIYKPHCGKCGFPIDTSEYEITYQDVYVYPNKCAHCGTIFDSIEIRLPKQLNDIS